jgi:hypothetical protein
MALNRETYHDVLYRTATWSRVRYLPIPVAGLTRHVTALYIAMYNYTRQVQLHFSTIVRTRFLTFESRKCNHESILLTNILKSQAMLLRAK